MDIIAASILTIFLNKREDNKILACLLILYIILIEIILYYNYLTFSDYMDVYTILSLWLCYCVYSYTEKDYYHKLFAISVILPQLYYLAILYKPYVAVEGLPMWFLFNADYIFLHGVFFVLYEHRVTFSFRGMVFKDFMINVAILLIFILF